MKERKTEELIMKVIQVDNPIEGGNDKNSTPYRSMEKVNHHIPFNSTAL